MVSVAACNQGLVESIMHTAIELCKADSAVNAATLRVARQPPNGQAMTARETRLLEAALRDESSSCRKAQVDTCTGLLASLFGAAKSVPPWFTGPWLEAMFGLLLFAEYKPQAGVHFHHDNRTAIVDLLTLVYLACPTDVVANQCCSALAFWSNASVEVYKLTARMYRDDARFEINTSVGLFRRSQLVWPKWLSPSKLLAMVTDDLCHTYVEPGQVADLQWPRGSQPAPGKAYSDAKATGIQLHLLCKAFVDAAVHLSNTYMAEMNALPGAAYKEVTDVRRRHLDLYKVLGRMFPEGTDHTLTDDEAAAVVAEFDRVAVANRADADVCDQANNTATQRPAYIEAKCSFDNWIVAMGHVAAAMRQRGVSRYDTPTHSLGGREILMRFPITLLQCLRGLDRALGVTKVYDTGLLDNLVDWCRTYVEGEGNIVSATDQTFERGIVFNDHRVRDDYVVRFHTLHTAGELLALRRIIRLTHRLDFTAYLKDYIKHNRSKLLSTLFGPTDFARAMSPVFRAAMTHTPQSRAWMRSLVPKKPHKRHDPELVNAWLEAASGPCLPVPR